MNTTPSHPNRERYLCGLAYVCAFLVLASTLVHHFGFPLDDSWIHQVIARNFAQYHRLGFAPGKLTAGSTSLLWSSLFALYWSIFPDLSPVIANAVTSVVIVFCIGYTLKAMTEEDGLPSGVSWCLALAPLASGNFVWFGMIGMEHLLFILLSLCVIRTWHRPSQNRRFSDLFLLALFSFLLVLTRPEGLFLGLLLLVTIRIAGRSVRALLAAYAGISLALIVLIGTNWMISHRLTPQTMQGRQFLYRFSAQTAFSMRLNFLGQIVARCFKTWSFYASRELLHHRGLLLGVPLVLLLALGLIAGVRALLTLHAHRFLMLCIWAAVIILLYTAVLPSTGHGGRYLSFPLMLFLPLEFLGLYEILSVFQPTRRHAWMLISIVAITSGAWSLTLWRHATIAQIDQIESEHGAMATWLQNTFSPEAFVQGKIAVFDIGRIGYQLHGNVVDLGGLMDASYLPYVLQRRTADYLSAHGVEYVVLPSAANENSADWMRRLSLEGTHGVYLDPVYSVCVGPYMDWLAENSANTAYACQRAYKLVYSTSLGH
jgi:hypothetical protein